MKRLVPLLYMLITLCSCERDADLKEFTKDSTVRLSVQGVTQFCYNPRTCQLGFCRQKGEFRAHTDDMSDFFAIVLDKIPSTAGSHVTGNVTWTTSTSLEYRQEVTFEAIKLEGDVIWLRSEAERISAVLKVLE